MEGKKVLWVIFSVALFLVVVLAGGLYFLRPKPQKAAEAPAKEAPSIQGFDAFEYVRGRSELPGLAPAEEKPEETVIVVGERPPAAKPAEKIRPADERQPAAEAPAAKPAPAAAASAPAEKKQPPAPKQVRVSEYWIQAGSYISASRADEVARTLEEKGLAAKTTTRELDGKTHFRVRIGPYASKAEAEKFLSWIKELQGFESSYISMVYSRRTTP